MQVRMLMDRAGPNIYQRMDEVIEVPDDEGERMIAAGQCVLVGSTGPIETTAVVEERQHGSEAPVAESGKRRRGRPRKYPASDNAPQPAS